MTLRVGGAYMSFNPMMALLVRATLDLLEHKPSVVELGNQTFQADDATLRRVIEGSRQRSEVDNAGLASLLRLSPEERRGQTSAYYRCLGFSAYDAIDVNDTWGSLVMDLNRDLVQAYGFRRTFSLVTNNGTGEHVFDQGAVLRNVHALASPGGLMLHLLPFLNYVNHGFYGYHPNLFHALAAANGYRLLALGVGDRDGAGAVALPESEARRGAASPGQALAEETPELLLPRAQRVSLAALLSAPKRPSRSLARRAQAFGRRLAGKQRPGDQFGAALDRLQHRRPDLLVFALLRKLADRPFRAPIQGVYSDAVRDPSLRMDYGLVSAGGEARR